MLTKPPKIPRLYTVGLRQARRESRSDGTERGCGLEKCASTLPHDPPPSAVRKPYLGSCRRSKHAEAGEASSVSRAVQQVGIAWLLRLEELRAEGVEAPARRSAWSRCPPRPRVDKRRL